MAGRSAPWAGDARVGVKHRVVRWLAFRGGLAAGGGPWGAWTSGDVGFVFAYENPDIVPFLAADVQLSLPIDPLTEHATTTDGAGTVTDYYVTPAGDVWLTPSFGFRIPFCRGAGCRDTRVSLLIAGTYTVVLTFDDHGWGALGAEAGLVIEP